MLPIRQTLNALPGLKRTEKAVLIEVCQLAENSEPAGWCTAKNDYLVQALGGTERTISRTLTALESRGLLLSQGLGKARRLAPSPALRACYTCAEEADRRAAAATLNLDKSGAQPRQNEPVNLDNSDPNLDKNNPQPSQSGEVEADQPRQNGSTNLDKSGHEPRQNGSRVYGDQHYQQFTSSPPTPEEWASAQKKIGDLQQELTLLKARLARTPAPPVAGHPPAGYRDFTAAWPENLTPPFQTSAFLAAWAEYAGFAAEIGKPFGPVSEKRALTELGRFAAGDHGRALRILSHNITQRYRTLTNDDGTQTPRPATGQRPGATGPGRVETLPATSYGRNRSQPSTPAADPTPAAAA